MFSINFARFAKNLIPWFLRTPRFKQWIGVVTWGSAICLEKLRNYRTLKDYEIQFTGQRLYLERWLNDKFDPVNQLITVTNVILTQNPFVYNSLEQRETYLVNKWVGSQTYTINDRIGYGGKIFKALTTTTGNVPSGSPASWVIHREQLYLFNKGEIGSGFVFIVTVPATITLSNQVHQNISDQINKFLIAGKQYQIISA
tara:strand:- start:617 stop:1216 length:600 start_codon:yes stop_codon:yes gene_type:complete